MKFIEGLQICCISTGQRIIGEISEEDDAVKIVQPFTLEEMIMEDEDEEFITTQVSLIYYTSYSKSESVIVPKAHIICTMEPSDEMNKAYYTEVESVKEQRAKKEVVKKESGGTVVAFKKKN